MKKKKQQRTVLIQVCVTEDHNKLIKKLAKITKKTKSTYLYDIWKFTLTTPHEEPEEYEDR